MDEQQKINVVASSSNSSSMVSTKNYDVFLSFRGEDTRRNFTSHLYKALNDEKVKTYIDDQLEKGDEISTELFKAIEDSHVSIIIFSENYASSKWCLGELSKILECMKENGQIVIPVFYNLDPSHVRKQTGSYEQAFANHEGEPMCNKWKADLTKAANLGGWDSRFSRTETEFLKDIVEDVLKKLAPRYPNQPKGMVGIEESYKQIESLLEMELSKIKTLGIWGMGGIGKTTLATALYDKLSCEFESHCFLANVREKAYNLNALHDELYSKLLVNKKHGFDHFGISRLSRKKVFIVLDDVDTSEQLEKLIVEYDFLGLGSRVIVTTRNKQILSSVDEIYPVQDLSSYHSLQLFCLTVFGGKQPKYGYEDLSERVISYCKGNPLALKVLGASLRSRSKDTWESELKKLQKNPNMKIHKVLKLSYDDLDRSQQDIFLDIACFFKEKRKDDVISVLEAFDFFPASGIEVLLDKALITISYDNRIKMHDLIQEMGWEIVHEESSKDPGRRSRLWRPEEVHDVLKYNMGTDVVEGIILDLHKLTSDICLSFNCFAQMTKLRFLQIHKGDPDNSKFNVYLPNGLKSLTHKLRYLHWDGFCLESLPSNFFCVEQIVELRMPCSKLKKLWDGIQNLVNLKIIDLYKSQDLIKIPDLSMAEKLEGVYLGKCKSLRQLHLSKLSLPKLTYVDLSGCREIKSLNVHSKSLISLDLDGCSSLKDIIVTSEEMTKLDLSGTAICALSSSISHISSLEMLDLSGTNVKSLSTNIKNLSMLKELYLDDCRKLISVPKLPPTLFVVRALNCISLKTEIIQRSVLQHMLQNNIPYLYKHDNDDSDDDDYHNEDFCTKYFMFPGDHVIDDKCGFSTAGSSITISYLPISHLRGFIYCIVLPKGSTARSILVSISQGCLKIVWHNWNHHKYIYGNNLISDHVILWYHDVSNCVRISEEYCDFSDITFIFEFNDLYGGVIKNESIKGCGVFPVYATTSGFKLVSSNMESF